jgi:hypothetical protein
MFGGARGSDGREPLDVEQLEAEVNVVDFVHPCTRPDEFGQMCDKIAQSRKQNNTIYMWSLPVARGEPPRALRARGRSV